MSNEIESNQNINIDEPAEKIKDIADKKSKFNIANLPIILELVSIVLYINLMPHFTHWLYYSENVVLAVISYYLTKVIIFTQCIFPLFCFIALFFQILNKNKTIADKIFLTINLLYNIIIFTGVAISLRYMFH